MKETLIIAGFGGQGVLSMGKILAYSGVMQDFEVTWMPSYGPEMRGGTANVTVILSDRKISSPIAYQYDTAIILNQQSMDKFEAKVRPGGTLIYDTNGITHHPTRTDIRIYTINAAEESAKLGNSKLFNTMILGGYLKVCPVVTLENVALGLKKSLPERAWKMLPENEKAIPHVPQKIRLVRLLTLTVLRPADPKRRGRTSFWRRMSAIVTLSWCVLRPWPETAVRRGEEPFSSPLRLGKYPRRLRSENDATEWVTFDSGPSSLWVGNQSDRI